MIEKVDMYSVVCNNCNEAYYDEHNGFIAWSDESLANENAMNAEWYKENDKHYCPKCFSIDDDDNLIITKLSARGNVLVDQSDKDDRIVDSKNVEI
jgi:hypothetical protein